ncbi:unnamed protein product, partial [Protopolystoma xenopodis]
EKVRAEEEADERRRAYLVQLQHRNAAVAAAQHRLSMAARLPPEPPAPGSPAGDAFLEQPAGRLGIATLRFRLPRGITRLPHETNPDHNAGERGSSGSGARSEACSQRAEEEAERERKLELELEGERDRMPILQKGGLITRRFAGTNTLEDILGYIESLGFPVDDFKLLTTYPSRDVRLILFPPLFIYLIWNSTTISLNIHLRLHVQ